MAQNTKIQRDFDNYKGHPIDRVTRTTDSPVPGGQPTRYVAYIVDHDYTNNVFPSLPHARHAIDHFPQFN